MTPEFEADVRSRINPLYAEWRGTESHERAILLAEIDRLRAFAESGLIDGLDTVRPTEIKMEHPIIITFPKGQLGAIDKDRLAKHGIIWLEAESDHKAIHQLAITQPLVQSVVTGDAIVVAALNAMAAHGGTDTLRAFVKGLAESVKVPTCN